VAACAALCVALAVSAAELGYSRSVKPGLVAHLERQHGSGVRGRIEGWQAFVRDAAKEPGSRLVSVNRFFSRIPPYEDLALWGAEDYWATPAETLAINGADCEDYALAKYFALKELGVPVERLRLVYATTWRSRIAHMVLAYYEDPRGEPLILDNLESGIRPASERPDLVPVYSFNDEDLLVRRPGQPDLRASPASSRKWREFRAKLEREQAY
jgi:predicted transglutaminase-like cysteine proteinase